MRYKITFGNEYTESRLLSADELDNALGVLEDVFEGRVYISSIAAQPNGTE